MFVMPKTKPNQNNRKDKGSEGNDMSYFYLASEKIPTEEMKGILLSVYKYLNTEKSTSIVKVHLMVALERGMGTSHARGRFKSETSQANAAYGIASYFDNPNLILLKNYFLKKITPTSKKLVMCLQSAIYQYSKSIPNKEAEYTWLLDL